MFLWLAQAIHMHAGCMVPGMGLELKENTNVSFFLSFL